MKYNTFLKIVKVVRAKKNDSECAPLTEIEEAVYSVILHVGIHHNKPGMSQNKLDGMVWNHVKNCERYESIISHTDES